jgi:hypothetical protein
VTMAEQHRTVRDNAWSPVKRFVGIVAIYLLVGPPIGGIIFWIAAVVTDISRDRALLSGAFPALIAMVAFSYPFGAPLAFVSGVIDAVAAIWFRQTSMLVPALAACLVSGAGSAMIFWTTLNVYSNFWLEFRSSLGVLLPAALIAALICWRLTRRFARMA